MVFRVSFLIIVVAVSAIAIGLLLPRGNSYAAACPGTMQPSEGIAGIDFLQFNRAIVPCGRKCDDGRTGYNEELNCTLCHLLIMVKNIFDLLFAWLIIVTLLFITIAGVIYIVSSGNPGMKALAKGTITKTLTGFIVFVLSWLIVYTALVFLSAGSTWGISAGDSWSTFTCDETSSPFN